MIIKLQFQLLSLNKWLNYNSRINSKKNIWNLNVFNYNTQFRNTVGAALYILAVSPPGQFEFSKQTIYSSTESNQIIQPTERGFFKRKFHHIDWIRRIQLPRRCQYYSWFGFAKQSDDYRTGGIQRPCSI